MELNPNRIIVVYGAICLIGNKFIKHFNSNWKIVISKMRAENYLDIKNELESIKPNNVLCCIGRTHGKQYSTIDYLEF